MARAVKDSGIDWLGKIPAHWKIISIGRLFNISAGGDAKPEYYSDMQDEEHRYPVYTNSMNKNQVYAYTSKPIYLANTITVTGRGAIGTAFYRNTPYDAIIRLLSLSPKLDLNCRFYAYWIGNVIHFFTDSAAVGQLSTVQMSSYKTAYCSKDEQQRIANFLDEKCALIDSVIEKTRASIAEYKKLKQSVITRAVTKGLQPSRLMKDSGIEWIGKIPAHWKVQKLKHSIKWKSEKNKPDAKVLSLYRDYGIIPKDSRNDNHNVTSLNTSSYKVVSKGDLVINKMKAWQGSLAISDYEGIISPAYHICIVINPKIYLKYLHYLLRNQLYLPEYKRLSTGMRIGQWDLGFEDFIKLPFILPPIDEQREIANFLDEKCGLIDELITKKETLLTELGSYKKSLIFEYVTGKKEVAKCITTT